MAGRRGRGEGAIGKTADGRWWARITVGYRVGTKTGEPVRVRRAVYGQTRADVARKLGQLLKDQADGLPVDGSRQTVEQYLEHYLSTIARPSLRPSTYRSYEDRIRRHVVPHIGRVPLTKLTPQRLQSWVQDAIAAGSSPQSVRYSRAVLRAALARAVRWGLLARNPATLVDLPRTSKAVIRPFTPDQARNFLAAAVGHRLGAVFTVAMAVGLRQGEALGLSWPDVDLEAGQLHVRRSLQREGGNRKRLAALRGEHQALLMELATASHEAAAALQKRRVEVWKQLCAARRRFVLGEPKSAASRRTITLPAVVLEALKTHRRRQLEVRLAMGRRWQEAGLVFTTRHGTPIDPRAVSAAFHALCRKAGVPQIRFHDLRHTAASLLLAEGVSPRLIMETLGHSQISLTLNTYSHILPALQRDAADRMDAILRAKKSNA